MTNTKMLQYNWSSLGKTLEWDNVYCFLMSVVKPNWVFTHFTITIHSKYINKKIYYIILLLYISIWNNTLIYDLLKTIWEGGESGNETSSEWLEFSWALPQHSLPLSWISYWQYLFTIKLLDISYCLQQFSLDYTSSLIIFIIWI